MELKINCLLFLLFLLRTCIGNKNFDFIINNNNNNNNDTSNLVLIKDTSEISKTENLLKLWANGKKFILTDYLTDGEFEKRIVWNGIIAKLTKTDNEYKQSLSLWQVSNGHGLVQMILNNNELTDCEFVRRKNLVDKFWEDFYHDSITGRSKNSSSHSRYNVNRLPMISNHEFNKFLDDDVIPEDFYDLQNILPVDEALVMTDFSYRPIQSYNEIPDDLKKWLNYKELKLACKQRIRLTKQLALKKVDGSPSSTIENKNINQRSKRSLLDTILMAPNTRWCGRGHSASKYNDLGGASRADRCCRAHDHCKSNIQAMSTKWLLFNYRPYTISHCSCDIRQRRDLSSLLRVPNTKWCGKGFSAKKYSELGGLSKADRCCRNHDYTCNLWILGFETKYYLFNWRVNTLMHCRCDERFRTCLKMADTSDANMVGKLFFNIVQTKCFVLKSEKVCKKRDDNGKCVKKILRKRAHLRDNRKF